MACPFFVPAEPAGSDRWLHAPRFPLGEEYRGVCQAGAEPFEPEESSQREVCNCGYARGRCDRFPAEAPDAVRFSVIGDDGARLRIVYVFERDHAPERHGVIEYSKPVIEIEDELLRAQAGAFIASYLRRAAKR